MQDEEFDNLLNKLHQMKAKQKKIQEAIAETETILEQLRQQNTHKLNNVKDEDISNHH